MNDHSPQASNTSENTASWARRVLALFIDWIGCTLVVMLVMGPAGWSESRYSGFYVIGVFLLECAVLCATMGGSFGQLLARLRVVRIGNQPIYLDLLRSVVRAVLVCLVIPPLVFRPDGRGLHDMAVGSRTITLVVPAS